MKNTLYKQKLIDEIRFALPSKRILEVVSNAAVTNPYNNETYHLKQREDVPIEEYQVYSKKIHYEDDYSEIFKKNIMIHPSILHPRARIAFEQLTNI